jgi:hypothetical protein
MQRLTSIAFRTLFFFGFLIVLPILALPKVSGLVDRLLYDDSPTIVKPPVIETAGQQVVEPQFAERVSPAKFEESLVQDPAAGSHRPNGLDEVKGTPPLLSPLPTFVPAYTSAAADAPPLISQLDDAAHARLQQVRERLETLGAKYMVLETATGPASFRFHCEMLVDPRSTATQNFDVSSVHPVEAAETVLRQVEAWRTAAIQTGTIR